MISVDNGTNAVAVDRRELQAGGVDVIVTDHHGTSENVADAFCVLNPRLPDAGYPDRDLAGCGVAFKPGRGDRRVVLGQAMRRSSEFADFLDRRMATSRSAPSPTSRRCAARTARSSSTACAR